MIDKIDNGFLCCIIGIICSIGSIIINLSRDGYRAKISKSEISIEKNDLAKLHTEIGELRETAKEIKELREIVKELKEEREKNRKINYAKK